MCSRERGKVISSSLLTGGPPRNSARPALKMPCLEVLWDLRSTGLERSRQRLRVAGSNAAVPKPSNPPLSRRRPLRTGSALAFSEPNPVFWDQKRTKPETEIETIRGKRGISIASIGRIEGLLRGGGLDRRGRGGLLTGAARAVRQVGGEAAQPLGVHAGPGRAPFRCAAGLGSLGWGGLSLNTPRPEGGSRAEANLAPAVGRPKCSRIAPPSRLLHVRQHPPPASTPAAGEHIQHEGPL